MAYIHFPMPRHVPPVVHIGGKAHNLARLASVPGISVPPWVAVASHAYTLALGLDGARSVPPYVATELQAALAAITTMKAPAADAPLFAVRSSAVFEDGTSASFAGQLASCLYVPATDVLQAVVSVWQSLHTPHAVAYMQRAGIAPQDATIAVIVQLMVDPEVSGVAFGFDPVSGNRKAVVVSAVYGAGEGLVSGQLDADTYTVSPHGVQQSIVAKTHAIRLDPDTGAGTTLVPVPEALHMAPALSPEQLHRIVSVTTALGAAFGRPQDVEWAIDADGQLFVLQTRPVTTLGSTPDTTQERIVWDNSNIVESYAGVTTPLTFSFVQEVYSEVYRQFVKVMGVDAATVEAHPEAFTMLGFIEGRIYYNLLSWHRLISLLPFYSLNAGFMEQMMGVREKLISRPLIQRGRMATVMAMPALLLNLVRRLVQLPRDTQRFHEHLNTTLKPYETQSLDGETPGELLKHYQALESALLRRWTTPIVNDFFVMIFYGLLKQLTGSWLHDTQGTLQNDLLCGEGGIISTEPVRWMRRIGNTILADAALRDAVLARPTSEVWALVQSEPMIAVEVQQYIARFGDRWSDELKLETITPREDPTLLGSMIQSAVRAGYYDATAAALGERMVREQAEQDVRQKLRGKPLKRMLFTYVLHQARERVKGRENLRFERTRVFSAVRAIFMAMGRQLAAEDVLGDARDVFLLSKPELFSYMQGTSVHPDLRTLVAQRRELELAYKTATPANRFETYGAVYHANDVTRQPAAVPVGGDVLAGQGCCAGVVRARVVKVTDPATAGDLRGCIMAAERTDPGWAPLFPQIAGLVVERGSLLSHSAIVARELAIPTVVGVADLMQVLRDGEMVEIDGKAGTIRLVERAGGQA